MFYVKGNNDNEVFIWMKTRVYGSNCGMWNPKKKIWERMSIEEFLNLAKENNWFWKHSPIKTYELIKWSCPESEIIEVEV